MGMKPDLSICVAKMKETSGCMPSDGQRIGIVDSDYHPKVCRGNSPRGNVRIL